MKNALPTRDRTRYRKVPAVNAGHFLPLAALSTAVFLWGGSFAAMRLAVQAVNPLSVVWLRMIIALAVILPFAGHLKISIYRRGDWKSLVPMVLFQPCLYFLLESNALRYTTSSQAGVISALVPLLVAVGAWFMLGGSVGKYTFSGLLVSVSGVAVLSFSWRAGYPGGLRPL
jgi:drug/metabolite transporter (DMT)-like permease